MIIFGNVCCVSNDPNSRPHKFASYYVTLLVLSLVILCGLEVQFVSSWCVVELGPNWAWNILCISRIGLEIYYVLAELGVEYIIYWSNWAWLYICIG